MTPTIHFSSVRDKAVILLPVLIFLMAMISCEYPLTDDEITHVDPPAPYYPLHIDLMNSGDTLFLFNRHLLSYKLSAFGQKIHAGEMLLADDRWELSNATGDIEINPFDYSPGVYKLSVNMFTSTGSGSLADLSGYEYYAGTREWVALIDTRNAEYLQMTADTDENGFLRIRWQPSSNFNMKSLRFNRSYQYTTSGRDFNPRHPGQYTDSCYTCGEVNYSLYQTVYTTSASTSYTSLQINREPPVPVATYTNLDSVTFTWNRTGYPTHYTLSKSNSPIAVYLDSSTDTSITVAQPGFGRWGQYSLSSKPINTDKCKELYYPNTYTDFGLGEYVAPNWPVYAYNPIEKVFYTSVYNDMKTFDIYSLNATAAYPIPNLLYDAIFDCPPNSTRVGVAARQAIYLFEDRQLTNPTIIPYGTPTANSDHFCLTSENTAALILDGDYTMIDLSTGEITATLDIEDYPYYSKWACISTAPAGDRCVIVTRNGIWLYNIENNAFETAYRDQRSYKSAMFDDLNQDRLFLTLEESPVLELRNPHDFSLIQSVQLPGKCVLRNIDPESGYLLLTDYTNLYVMDTGTWQIVLKVPSTDSMPQLYNNRLFSNSGYVFDITPYLP
jgi:hypothetical protein